MWKHHLNPNMTLWVGHKGTRPFGCSVAAADRYKGTPTFLLCFLNGWLIPKSIFDNITPCTIRYTKLRENML